MSRPTLYDPHELQHTRLLMSIESVMPSHHLISNILFSSCFQSFTASGSFPVSQHFTPVGQSIGASASSSILTMNIQGWFLLGLNCLISFLSMKLSGVFCSTTVSKQQFSTVLSRLSSPDLTVHT